MKTIDLTNNQEIQIIKSIIDRRVVFLLFIQK